MHWALLGVYDQVDPLPPNPPTWYVLSSSNWRRPSALRELSVQAGRWWLSRCQRFRHLPVGCAAKKLGVLRTSFFGPRVEMSPAICPMESAPTALLGPASLARHTFDLCWDIILRCICSRCKIDWFTHQKCLFFIQAQLIYLYSYIFDFSLFSPQTGLGRVGL